MSNLFFSHQFLGELRIANIYEEYDGPRIFSVENGVGAMFVAYWIGEDYDYDNWFLIPASKTKILAYENRKIDLLSLISKHEEDNFYKVRLPFDEDELSEEVLPLKSKDINTIKLPRAGIYVKDVISASIKSTAYNENLIPTHELKLEKSSKKSKKNVLLEHVTRVCEKFSELAQSFNIVKGIHGDIQPLAARYGSFSMSLHASEMTEFESVLKTLSEMMMMRKDIKSFLVEKDIDIKSFSSLLEAIVFTHVNFEFTNKFSDDKDIIRINKSDADFYYRGISGFALQYVPSYRVPQGNDINKVFKVVDLAWEGKELTAAALRVEERIVKYYISSAKILGFFESNGAITSLGQQLVSAENEDMRLRITARAFETSSCCWAWINWSGVSNLSELDPSTANNFLLESCLSLSDETAKRRASTISGWCVILQKHYTVL